MLRKKYVFLRINHQVAFVVSLFLEFEGSSIILKSDRKTNIFGMTNASKSVCKKSTMAKRIGTIIIIADWILFLGFGALASHFMLSVIDHFQAKTTSFSQSLEPITKLPTILMCIEGSRIFNYSKLITLSYSNQGRYYEKIENIKENEIYHFKHGNETFQVVQAQDKCLKLESNLTSPYQQGTRATFR